MPHGGNNCASMLEASQWRMGSSEPPAAASIPRSTEQGRAEMQEPFYPGGGKTFHMTEEALGCNLLVITNCKTF